MDAAIQLIDEGHGIPGAEMIAARAGVGLRSVFRHYGDLDALYIAMIDRIGLRFTPLLRPYEADTWQGQLDESLQRRMELFEGVLPFRRAAEVYRHRSALMTHGLEALERMLRSRLETVVPEEHRNDFLWFEQLNVWMSLEVYCRLRDRHGHDHATAHKVIRAAIDLLLKDRG